mmetsp:Transcript_13215/g.22237  ORF Transcript_13215/g.22237 Transcript_13215/m.22237 type:complete len:147 (+) Transcript_13215:250-690(+)
MERLAAVHRHGVLAPEMQALGPMNFQEYQVDCAVRYLHGRPRREVQASRMAQVVATSSSSVIGRGMPANSGQLHTASGDCVASPINKQNQLTKKRTGRVGKTPSLLASFTDSPECENMGLSRPCQPSPPPLSSPSSEDTISLFGYD